MMLNWIMQTALPPITPEKFTFDFIRSLVGIQAHTILDVGAHHGWHSVELCRCFPEAVIHAFEPDPRAILKFRERVRDPRVVLHEMAIAAMDGTAPFHVSSGLPPGIPPERLPDYPQGWDQSGSLLPPKNHLTRTPWCHFNDTIHVTTRSLDSWAGEQGVGAVDFIWADTQGAEGCLIQGGRELLARTRYLYTEYSNDELYEGEPDLATLLAMLPGFSVVKRYRFDVLLCNEALAGGAEEAR